MGSWGQKGWDSQGRRAGRGHRVGVGGIIGSGELVGSRVRPVGDGRESRPVRMRLCGQD